MQYCFSCTQESERFKESDACPEPCGVVHLCCSRCGSSVEECANQQRWDNTVNRASGAFKTTMMAYPAGHKALAFQAVQAIESGVWDDYLDAIRLALRARGCEDSNPD